MSQHDYNVSNQTYPATRSDLNNVLGAIQTQNSGSSAPSTIVANMVWADTTDGLLKVRNSADTAWIPYTRLSTDWVQAAKTGTYNIASSDNMSVVPFDCSAASRTCTLTSAATLGEGFRVVILKSTNDSNQVTIDPNSTETIAGETTATLSKQYQFVELLSDGTNWQIVNGNHDKWNLQAATLNNASFSHRNAIINGGFDIWQRGTSFTSDGYTADRWYVALGAGTGTVSRAAFAVGDSPGDGHSPRFGLRWNQTVAGTSATLQQRIEDVRTFANRVVTVSFYAKVASGTLAVSSFLRQNFGTGGSPSANVDSSTQSNTVTTSWQRFQHRISLASISGKTLGSNTPENNYLALILQPANSTFDLFVWGVQVEQGDVATYYECKSTGAELDACRRYYWKSFPQATTPAQNAGRSGAIEVTASGTSANYAVIATVHLPVCMRASPTLTTYNPSAANTSWRNIGAGTDVTASTTSASDRSFVVFNSGSATDQGGHTIHVTADAEL